MASVALLRDCQPLGSERLGVLPNSLLFSRAGLWFSLSRMCV